MVSKSEIDRITRNPYWAEILMNKCMISCLACLDHNSGRRHLFHQNLCPLPNMDFPQLCQHHFLSPLGQPPTPQITLVKSGFRNCGSIVKILRRWRPKEVVRRMMTEKPGCCFGRRSGKKDASGAGFCLSPTSSGADLDTVRGKMAHF